MTFNELFETKDEKLEKYLKNSNDWCWEDIQVYTHEWKSVARCYIDDDILSLLEKKDLKITDTFYVKNIGLLEFQYSYNYDKYYIELIEKDTGWKEES